MTGSLTINRRAFLGASGALVIAVTVPGCKPKATGPIADKDIQSMTLNAHVELATDGTVTIMAPHPEIGQGVKTSLPMIVAEELGVSWDKVTVKQSAISNEYGYQFAGGSMSVPMLWQPLREAGATARSMLVSAAAAQWSVETNDCRTEDGYVIHGDKRLGYGELVEAAAKLDIPDKDSLKFKDPKDFNILGRRITGVDNLAIVTGQPLFGIDQKIDNMHFATYSKCPAVGGTVKSANLDAIKSMPGIVDAFVLDAVGEQDALKPGVAIVGNSTFSVFKAKEALEVDWDLTNASSFNWNDYLEKSKASAVLDGDASLFNDGDVDTAFKAAKTTVERVYAYPFLPHAPLEPQNCTAHVQGDKVEIWAPTQTPTGAAQMVAKDFGFAPESITLNQTRCGGGFGRRLFNDFVAEAVAISKKTGLPIKVQWTRPDGMTNDYFRPGGVHGCAAAIDENGKINGWKVNFHTFSKDGKTPGGSPSSYPDSEFPRYLVENYSVNETVTKTSIPMGWWRAPVSNAFAFVYGSFLHEIAHETGRDYVELMLEMFGDDKILPAQRGAGMNTGRAKDVVKEVLKRSNWGKSLPKGRAQGLGFYYSHSGHIAEVVDLEVFEDKSIKVHKVDVVADVGPIVNLSGAENQCAGSVIDGLSTMMNLQVDIQNGRIPQGNFDEYPLMRLPNTPQIDVHFIQSNNPPTGLGEPALPPLAPAICNAIFSATGDRVRELPLSKSGYSFSA